MLLLEFAGLFFVMPSLLAWAGPGIQALAVLWVVSIPCFFFLRRDPNFDRRALWGAGPFPKGWTSVAIPFCGAAAALGFAVWRWAPQRLFDLAAQNTILWALLLCLYAVLSVYPQGLVYRTFFERRYAALFGNFLVCARKPYVEGRMQQVELRAARHLFLHGKPFAAQP